MEKKEVVREVERLGDNPADRQMAWLAKEVRKNPALKEELRFLVGLEKAKVPDPLTPGGYKKWEKKWGKKSSKAARAAMKPIEGDFKWSYEVNPRELKDQLKGRVEAIAEAGMRELQLGIEQMARQAGNRAARLLEAQGGPSGDRSARSERAAQLASEMASRAKEYAQEAIDGYADKARIKVLELRLAGASPEEAWEEAQRLMARDNHWKVTANQWLVNARSVAMCGAASDAGVEWFVIQNPLDEKTTPFCREVAGKLIPIGPALDLFADSDGAGSMIDQSQKGKFILPSGKTIRSSALGKINLTKEGIGFPPYHINCRSLAIPVAPDKKHPWVGKAKGWMPKAKLKKEVDKREEWFRTRTANHIRLVNKYARIIAEELSDKDSATLIANAILHDSSKYEEPERAPYVLLSWKKKMENEGGKMALAPEQERSIHDATLHHVRSNRHHPEYHDNGAEINRKDRDAVPDRMTDATGMTDVDIAEMCADWLAMSEELGGDPREWVRKNVNKRWRFTDKQAKLIDKLVEAGWSLEKWNPDQPRDGKGRWSSGGASSGTGMTGFHRVGPDEVIGIGNQYGKGRASGEHKVSFISPDDGEEIDRLIDDLDSFARKDSTRHQYARRAINNISEGVETYVARDEKGNMTGIMSCISNGETLFVDRLATKDGTKGAGRKLMMEAFKSARRSEQDVSLEATAESMGFYEHIGMGLDPETVAYGHNDHFLATWDELPGIMAKLAKEDDEPGTGIFTVPMDELEKGDYKGHPFRGNQWGKGRRENFDRWFGKSKVVDENGDPLVVYHGTSSNFKEFSLIAPYVTDPGWYGKGLYFTPDTEQAGHYATAWDSDKRSGRGDLNVGANVMPVFLRIENPVIVNRKDNPGPGEISPDEFNRRYGMSNPVTARARMVEEGHDGVIVIGAFPSTTEYVAFNPEQVKSAIANIGEYGEGRDITKADGRWVTIRGNHVFIADKNIFPGGPGTRAYTRGQFREAFRAATMQERYKIIGGRNEQMGRIMMKVAYENDEKTKPKANAAGSSAVPFTKGDLPGHPFRGNQYTGGLMSSDGDYDTILITGDNGKDELPKYTTKEEVAAWLKRNPRSAEILERQVKGAADKAGYKTFGSHATDKEFNEFDRKYAKDKIGRRIMHGLGKDKFYFTDFKQESSKNRPRVVNSYLKIEKPMVQEQYEKMMVEEGGVADIFSFPDSSVRDKAISRVDKKIRNLGYDGVVGDTQIAIWNPNAIKSADPITLADDGRIIALSERFNSSTADIRKEEMPSWVRLEKGDLPGHPFRGNQWTGGMLSSSKPRIFAKPDDIVEHDDWGKKYYGWDKKKQPDKYGVVPGRPLTREEIPEELYHVTTAIDAVKKDGMLLGGKDAGGMGGGQDLGVSFTSSKSDAELMERELRRSISFARGEMTIDDVARMAREDEKLAGLPEGSLERGVKEARRAYDVNAGIGSRTEDGMVELAFEAYRSYRLSRDIDAIKFPDKKDILKDPVIVSSRRQLMTKDPSQIGTVTVKREAVPSEALVTTGSDEFLHEVRVYSDVPLKKDNLIEKAVSWLFKGDYLGHPFRGNQWTGGNTGVSEFDIAQKKIMSLAESKYESLRKEYGDETAMSCMNSLKYATENFMTGALTRIAENLDEIEFKPTVESMQYAASYAMRSNPENVRGMFDYENKKAILNGPDGIGEYIHELAHALDGKRVEGDRLLGGLSNDADWIDAWKSEIEAFPDKLTKYSTKNQAEGFAEYARLIASGTREAQKAAREQFPKCWEFWKKNGIR